jgi:glutaredoxin 3
MAAKVEIYTSPFCPYCSRAKHLLGQKGVQFEEIDIMANPSRRQEMLSRSDGRYTVPQIFIDGRGVGGSDDIHALDRKGELDRMLGIGA